MTKNRFLGVKNGFPDPPRPSPTAKNQENGPKNQKNYFFYRLHQNMLETVKRYMF